MAKVEITCTDDLKDSIKKYSKLKGVSVASYIKMAVIKQMKLDEKER